MSVCKIPLCPTFAASGSAGKGNRPMDLGPDYKPPLGGECGAKLLLGSTLRSHRECSSSTCRGVPAAAELLWHFHNQSSSQRGVKWPLEWEIIL